jgi:hypothetical protein
MSQDATMNTPRTQNHRLYSRVPFATQVDLHLGDQCLHVALLDIAFKGALLKTQTQLTVALRTPCRLVLPLASDDESIEMHGKVVHLEADHIGMACDDIDLQSLTNLRRLLALNTGDAELMDRELVQLFGKTAT